MAYRALHAIYAVAVALTLGKVGSRIGITYNVARDAATATWLVIGVCLVVDNLRCFVADAVPFACELSKLCFFGHEVVTPLGLIFVSEIYHNHSLNTVKMLWVNSLFFTVGFFFTLQGATRFFAMWSGEWELEPNAHGIQLCRPKDHDSIAALLPIFLTVFLLMAASTHMLYFEKTFLLRKEKGDDDRVPEMIASQSQALTQRNKRLGTLLLGQIVVFLGNGLIGPNKALQGLLGNGLEILWLWSIGQALVH